MTQTTLPQPSLSTSPIWYFAAMQGRAAVRNKRVLMVSLFLPIFILTLFAVLSAQVPDDGPELMSFMFPAIVSFSVMLSGGTQAMRIVNWRQLGVFRRLSATPIPLGHLLLGDVLSQVVLGLAQGLLTLLFGVFVLRLPINAGGTAVALFVLLLAGACFTMIGAFVGSITKRPETANSLFIFTLMPMFFLGGGMPPGLFPDTIQTIGYWLPVGVVNSVIQPLLAGTDLPANIPLRLLALAAYTVLFAALTVRFFKAE